MALVSDSRVQRDELVQRIRGVQNDLVGTAEESQRSLLGSAAAGVVLVVLVAYGLGRRAGRRRGGFIEIRR